MPIGADAVCFLLDGETYKLDIIIKLALETLYLCFLRFRKRVVHYAVCADDICVRIMLTQHLYERIILLAELLHSFGYLLCPWLVVCAHIEHYDLRNILWKIPLCMIFVALTSQSVFQSAVGVGVNIGYKPVVKGLFRLFIYPAGKHAHSAPWNILELGLTELSGLIGIALDGVLGLGGKNVLVPHAVDSVSAGYWVAHKFYPALILWLGGREKLAVYAYLCHAHFGKCRFGHFHQADRDGLLLIGRIKLICCPFAVKLEALCGLSRTVDAHHSPRPENILGGCKVAYYLCLGICTRKYELHICAGVVHVSDIVFKHSSAAYPHIILCADEAV